MDDPDYHNRIDRHRQSELSEIILGGQDGLVNVLGVLLGVAGATQQTRFVLAAGIAAAVAESLSMAAVAYTATEARRAHYRSELERERRHLERVPEIERDEVREIFRRKGFTGDLLERIVETITANHEVWLALMMTEEHRLHPDQGRSGRAALVVGVSSAVGSLVPLFPYLVLPIGPALWASLALSAATLFSVGAYKAITTVGHWLRSGLELAAIGMVTAAAGYGIGLLFQP